MTPNRSQEPRNVDNGIPYIIIGILVAIAASWGTWAMFTSGQLFQGPWR